MLYGESQNVLFRRAVKHILLQHLLDIDGVQAPEGGIVSVGGAVGQFPKRIPDGGGALGVTVSPGGIGFQSADGELALGHLFVTAGEVEPAGLESLVACQRQ